MTDDQIDDVTGEHGAESLASKVKQFAMRGLTRRTFLVAGGTAAAGAVVNNAFGPSADQLSLASPDAVLVGGNPTFVLVMRRPQDQCVLTLGFYNLEPDYTQTPPVLKVVNPGQFSHLAVAFGAQDASAPQHIAEEAFPESAGDDLPTQPAPAHPPNKPRIPKPTTSTVGAAPINARIAGTSRLVFTVPNSLVAPEAAHPIPLDTDHLLDWIGLTLSVVPNALPPLTQAQLNATPLTGVNGPVKPGPTETSIELPYGLVLSPPASPAYGGLEELFPPTTVFTNATQPVNHVDKNNHTWTELWHTRLAARVLTQFGELSALAVNETDRDLRTVRAVWCTPDNNLLEDISHQSVEPSPSPALPPFRTSLTYTDRYDIVRLSSDFGRRSGDPFQRAGVNDRNQPAPPFIPSPATVDNLMLSSLGGWLDCNAHWDLPHSTAHGAYNSSLLSWRHRAVQGRDSYVRVVRKGYLFPWGHRASLVTVTEREPTYANGGVGAYLRQKTFIVVGEPVKNYGGPGDFIQSEGRKLPFTSVQVLTLITPSLKSPAYYLTKTQQRSNTELVFQPKVGTSAFQFHMRGTDWAGDPIDFRSPVLWIDDTVAYGEGSSSSSSSNKTFMNNVISTWQKSYPSLPLHNQRVSVAEPKDPDTTKGDTQIVLSSFELGVQAPISGTTPDELVGVSQPAFYPALHSLSMAMSDSANLSGNSVSNSDLQYYSYYLDNGFVGNKGGVFLSTATGKTPRGIKFSSSKSGGAFTPDLTVHGFSREIGPAPAANLDNLRRGTFQPTDVFNSVDANLLGGLKLSTILQTVPFGDTSTPTTPSSDNAQALSMMSVERFNPHRIVSVLDWHPVIQEGGPTGAADLFMPTGDPNSSMDLHAVIVTDLENAGNSTSTVSGQIRDFTLNLFGTGATFFIKVPFDSLTFRSQSGHKTDVQVQVSDGGIEFQGALSFVQDLANYLNFDGSGLTIDTAGSAITATLTLAIPSIGLGVFSLENLAFNAGVSIPYNGDPVRFDFSFSSRENPFQLEIMIFSGGGYIGLGVGVDGVEMLEFGFDFGFGLSIDIGIASGQVSLTGGVSYECHQLSGGGQEIDFSAYVKASGGLSALGLVSVSVEMMLTLEYQSDGHTSSLAGDAQMSISVDILFFGFSVGFDVHEEFAGSDPNHSFASNGIGSHFANPALTASGADDPPWVSDPKPNSFGIVMAQADWDQYCTSFALQGV